MDAFFDWCKRVDATPDEIKMLANHLCTFRTIKFMEKVNEEIGQKDGGRDAKVAEGFADTRTSG